MSMPTLPAPITDMWILIAMLRRINESWPAKRNALPLNRDQLEERNWNEWTRELESTGIQVIPIDWETMKALIDGAPEPHQSKVNLCRCSRCGGAFGKAFAKHDSQGKIICRRCAETPTIPNDSDETPNGAD